MDRTRRNKVPQKLTTTVVQRIGNATYREIKMQQNCIGPKPLK